MKPTRKGPAAARAEGRVEKIVAGGAGLVRLPSQVVLVPQVAVGERVAFEVGRPMGRLLKVLEPAPERVIPACAHSARCGGCDLLHLTPEAQRAARLGILEEALAGLPREGRALPAIVYREAAPLHSRTRVRWHARRIGPDVMVGYHAAGSRTIVGVPDCQALDPRLEAALALSRELLVGAEGEGDVHAALGVGGRPVLSIAWRGALPPRVFGSAEQLVTGGKLAGVALHLDGAREPAKVGDPRPVVTLADGPLFAPIAGFSQASERGDAVLVQRVVALADPEGLEVIELFAGSGNLTVALAREAVHVTAVEQVGAACVAMRENVALRKLETRVKVIEADAEAYALPTHGDLVVLDPPRTGARGAIAEIVKKRPKRVVYVSCDPTTLGRDLRVLLAEGYVVKAIEALDLFPGTSHVESVVACERG